ncbi:protein PRR14L isoform X2 [Cuculus canorus]|uniref:protein PRR14L isoform X2 n=1 Tax=Cuculus canorus TaxID=55661 RepID=UPI0023AA95BE|nr:protein PRR14L isoform X2 [Cuculus canorus]
MLSSGVDAFLDSSVSAVTEGLYTGPPENISPERMAVSGPHVGSEATSEVLTPVLALGDGLSAEHHRAPGAQCFHQETEGLGDMFQMIPPRPAASLPKEVLMAGNLEEDEKDKKRNFRKLNCSSDGYQKEEEKAQDAEQYCAQCCTETPGERWSKQEDPHMNQHKVKPLGACCSGTVGTLINTEENQEHVQVTADTLPKLTEKAQGMKADGTRIFSKAGCITDRVSKGLPPESNQCSEVDTVMARAGVSETSTLDFSEPLKVTGIEPATEHPQENNEYSGLKARAAMPLRTGDHVVSVLETREEQNPVNEFSMSLANCQLYQQDEENNAYDFCSGPVPKHNKPPRLSSVESCRTLSTKSSEVLCPVQKSICCLDFRNTPVENSSTAVHQITNETHKESLPKTMESQTHYGHGTGFVENEPSTSIPVEQISVVRTKGLSRAKTDHREVSAGIGKSNSSEIEEAAEVRRKIAVGDNTEVGSWPEAQEGAKSEHYPSSVFSSVSSAPEEFLKEKLKKVLSEGNKLKKEQWQFSVGDLCKDDVKENRLMKRSKVASNATDICFYNASSKISPHSSYSCLDLSSKLEKDSPEAQLFEKESEVNTTSEELAGSSAEATEANSDPSLSTGKEANLICTLNMTLPPAAQKSRQTHCDECPPCTANEVSNQEKAQDDPSGKESVDASGTTREQVAGGVLHKEKFKSSVSSRTFDNPNRASRTSQKTMESSVGNTESVVTGLEIDHRDMWHCCSCSMKEQCTAASASCVLSGSACVDDVLPSSHLFNVEVKKMEEKGNLEGEASAGCHSKKANIFPEAHLPLACDSPPCEDDWGHRSVDLHGMNDVCTAKPMFCSAYASEKSPAALVGDEISSRNMEVVKQFDLSKLTGGSEIVCDRDEGKEQICTCALQTDELDKVRTVYSPKAHEDNQTSEQLLVRYLNVRTRHSSQTEKTIRPTEVLCLESQSELGGPVPGSKQYLESVNEQPNAGLQTRATSVEETKTSVGSCQSEAIVLEEKVVDLNSLNGVKNEDSSGCLGLISDRIKETVKLKEDKNEYEREDKEALGESFCDSKPHCSQHACFIECAKEKAELVFVGDKMQQPWPKIQWLVEDQENAVSARFLTFQSIHGSLAYKPENMDGLPEAENKSLRINTLFNTSCAQLTFEPSKETDAQKDVGASHFGKFDILEFSNETWVGSETPSALDLGVCLPEKEKLCAPSENAHTGNWDLFSAEVFSTNSSETKPLSVTVADLQYNATATFYPHVSKLSNGQESSPDCVVCSAVCVPYKLNAQSKDTVKEIAEGQDIVPTSVCKENEALGSERLGQIEKRRVHKQKKKYEKMGLRLSDRAQQRHKSDYQGKETIALQTRMLHSSGLLCSSSDEVVTSRNTKFEGPSEEIFAVRSSENKPYSTLQEIKRPKITTDIISSQFLKTQDSEMQNLNLNLGYDGIPGAFETANKLRGPLPLKIQPGRTCKKFPTSYQLKNVRKSKKIKSFSFFEVPPKQGNALLKSVYFPCKPSAMETEAAMGSVHMPRQRARRCALLNSLTLRRRTEEPALLRKLAAMASKLLAPAKSTQDLESQPRSSELFPVGERYSERRSKNLLEAFSCINRHLHSRWADSWCTKMFSFQPLALYPVESTKILFSGCSHEPPASFLDSPVFPISFHIKLDSSAVTDLTGIVSKHSVQHRPLLGEMPASPSKWTFSFLLSRSWSDITAFKEDSSLNNELDSPLSGTDRGAVALHPDCGRIARAGRRGACSMLGLHTVLALSSPGCYRIWTRRRNLTSHIPTIQRLFISQFAQGLKGARYPPSMSDDLVSSLPYSLGRALSIWSQHGPSARPSEITSLHSSHCRWQPSMGIENSYAMLPHFPVQSTDALQAAAAAIRLEASFPLLLPKSCSLPESSPPSPRLSASELQVHALDEADASVPACLRSQGDTELVKTEPEKRPKKVSQIRIRKTIPKPDTNLTPMGLPKPKRLKKKEFSLEEIYTNKNYKSPPPARSLETIFEEPKEKNGHLISVSQQKRKRILEFQDFTLPRKRKTRGKVKAVGSCTRAKKAALQSAELDILLSQKLMDLEAFFAEEAGQEQASSIQGSP